MPPADRIDLLLDYRLVTAAVRTALLCAVPAVVVGLVGNGRAGAFGALWGVGAVGVNAAAAAAISARGGRTRKEIGVGLVVALLPVRLILLGVALWAGTGPLGLPAWPVALAVCGTEVCVLVAQSRLVQRGPTFVGPMTERRS